MTDPQSANSSRLEDVLNSDRLDLRKTFQTSLHFLNPYARNSILSSLLFASLIFTLSLSFFFRQSQLDLIVSAQASMNSFTIHFLQFISDTKSILSVGLPVSLLGIALVRRDQILRNRSIFILAALIITGCASYSIKNAVRDSRPYEVDSRIQKLSVAGGYGFPSGHVAEAATVVIACFLIWPNLSVLFFSGMWLLMLMASRVYLGVHDIYQVFGGAFIGIIIPVLLERILFSLKGKSRTLNGYI